MYANMSYGNDKDVQIGDILMHKKWVANGKPLKLEVVKPNFFGSSISGQITVVLRDNEMHGFASRQSESLPQSNGGEAFVKVSDVKFSHRGNPEDSVFTPQKGKQRRRYEDEEDE